MAFIFKKSQDIKPAKKHPVYVTPENNKTDNKEVMDKISMAESIINDEPKAVKRIKKDKGLIERTESSKTILTEDNKQLLVD
jgi:hypothetical protein